MTSELAKSRKKVICDDSSEPVSDWWSALVCFLVPKSNTRCPTLVIKFKKNQMLDKILGVGKRGGSQEDRD